MNEKDIAEQAYANGYNKAVEEIQRLQAENETQRKIIEYQDGLPDLVEQQKAQIEQLTEELKIEKHNHKATQWHFDNSYNEGLRLLDVIEEYKKRETKLQKQVDELTAFKNEAISMSLYGKGRKDGEEIGRTQAVKDTAKEIYSLMTSEYECYIPTDIAEEIAKRYGVEVE